MASKYDPLSKHLESLGASAWHTTFREIERILSFRLPASARNHRSWWHNNTIGHPQAPAWMDIGWKTTDVDMNTETLVFRRVSMSVPRTSTSEAKRVPESVSQDNTPVKSLRSSGALTDQSGMPFDLDRLMYGLSQSRPIFHSREDLRRTLAAHIRKVLPDPQVQLKFPISLLEKNHYFDIWLETEKLVIELIYTTRGLNVDWGNERFLLREHGGQPPRRYEFLRRVQSVEQAISDGPAKMGCAILLTNNPNYWDPPSKQGVIDAAFRIHEGRNVTGELAWSEHTGAGTKENKEEPIDIIGSYDLHWRDYSRLGENNNQQFRYLAVEVQ